MSLITERFTKYAFLLLYGDVAVVARIDPAVAETLASMVLMGLPPSSCTVETVLTARMWQPTLGK